jgi:hypothetical protein
MNMQDFLKSLGIDPETLRWQDLAACKKLKTNLFFDDYESPNKVIAKQIDSICATCPVTKECYEFGRDKKEIGVYGGFYLVNGQVDSKRNEHKTQEIVLRLASKIYDE